MKLIFLMVAMVGLVVLPAKADTLDIAHAHELINNGEYTQAQELLYREEENTTDIAALCSIYREMLLLAGAQDNSTQGVKYTGLYRKCWRPDSEQDNFYQALGFYYLGDYKKANSHLDALINRIERDLSIKERPELYKVMMDNLTSQSYIIKATMLLKSNGPKNNRDNVIRLAKKAYKTTPYGDAATFLAAIYDLYGEDEQSKEIMKNSNEVSTEKIIMDSFLKSINDKVKNK